MFKKLVSNLPFTPSLLPQVSFYAKRLAKESATRKLGIVFAGLTIILQAVLFVSPPAPSLASSNNDIIFGGVSTDPARAKQQLIDHVYSGDSSITSPYNDQTYYDLDALFEHFDISADDIRNSELVWICSQCDEADKQKRSVGRLPNSIDASQDVKFKPADSRHSYYLRPLHIWDSGPSSRYQALEIRDGVWILLNCGNIVVDEVPDANLTITKTQSPANGTTLEAGSTVKYGFNIKNTGSAAAQNAEVYDRYPNDQYLEALTASKGDADAVTNQVKVGDFTYTRWVFSKIEPGETVSVSLQARVKAGQTDTICNSGSVNYRNAEGVVRKARSNQVCFEREAPPPSPSYSCEALNNTSRLNGTAPHTASFQVDYRTANGAQFEQIRYFIDGEEAGQSTSANFTHDFTEPGTYKVHAVVVTSAGTTQTSDDCAQTVTVEPPAASFVCQQLEVLGDVLGTEQLTTSFKVHYTLANTTLQQINFFVDGQLVASQQEPEYQHTFTELGAHTVDAVVVTDDGATEKSEACSTTVSVEETPDNSIEEDKLARVITGFNPITTDDNDQRSASVDGQTVKAGELIEYRLSVINSGNVSYSSDEPYELPAESVVDVLEYANVIDEDGQVISDRSAYGQPIKLFGGGTLDGGEITWPAIDNFEPGARLEKSIFVKIKDVIPKTNTPPSDPFSFDCTMSNTYINSSTVNIDVECPPEKEIEAAVTTLPNTGPLETAMVTGGFALLAFYLFSRNNLLVKELELVQSQYNGGVVR